MMLSICLFLLASAVAPADTVTPVIQSAAKVTVLVTDRRGKPVPSAHVKVRGDSEREGQTNKAGRVVFTNMKAGDYILRVERDRFITFEKDFAVSGNKRGPTPVVAAISPVPPLTPRPSRAAASARPVVVPVSSVQTR